MCVYVYVLVFYQISRLHLSHTQLTNESNNLFSSIEWQDMPREGCALTAFQVDMALPITYGSEARVFESGLIESFAEVRCVTKVHLGMHDDNNIYLV